MEHGKASPPGYITGTLLGKFSLYDKKWLVPWNYVITKKQGKIAWKNPLKKNHQYDHQANKSNLNLTIPKSFSGNIQWDCAPSSATGQLATRRRTVPRKWLNNIKQELKYNREKKFKGAVVVKTTSQHFVKKVTYGAGGKHDTELPKIMIDQKKW